MPDNRTGLIVCPIKGSDIAFRELPQLDAQHNPPPLLWRHDNGGCRVYDLICHFGFQLVDCTHKKRVLWSVGISTGQKVAKSAAD